MLTKINNTLYIDLETVKAFHIDYKSDTALISFKNGKARLRLPVEVGFEVKEVLDEFISNPLIDALKKENGIV